LTEAPVPGSAACRLVRCGRSAAGRRSPAGSSSSIAGAAPEASTTASSAASGSPPLAAAAALPAQQGYGGFLATGVERCGNVDQPLGAGHPGGGHERGRADQARDIGQARRPQPVGVHPHIEGSKSDPGVTRRGSFREVFLEGQLQDAIRRINLDPAGKPWPG